MKHLGSIGLSTKDETVLKALVDLLGARTHETWVYSTPDKADVILLDGDSAGAVALWESAYPGSTESTIVYSSNKAAVPVPVHRHLTKPLRAADLIAHLNAIGESVSPGSTSEQVLESRARSNEDAVPAGSLPQTIFDTKAGYLTISLSDYTLILNRDERSCVITGTVEQVVEGLVAQQGKLAVSFSQRKPEHLSEASVWLGDRSILWQLTLYLSHGKLLQQFGVNDALRLTRWPPPSLLKNNPDLLNLCALLSRRSGASFSEASEYLKLADSDLAGFLNAAAVCGMLVQNSAQVMARKRPAVKDEAEKAAKGLFARLRSRLGI